MPLTLIFILLASALTIGCTTGRSQSKGDSLYTPKPGTNEVDPRLVEDYLKEYRTLSNQALADVASEADFNRRAAAARVRLERDRIPVSSAGVDVIEARYLSGRDSKSQAYGFWLLGQLGLQGVANERIAEVILRFVEENPKDRALDGALWALGETGTDEALEDFYRIAADTDRYGPAARERSFCCISQCGRYSATTRFENIPRILKLASEIQEPETQKWCIMALRYMAPGVKLSSIPEWEKWWETQVRLRG